MIVAQSLSCKVHRINVYKMSTCARVFPTCINQALSSFERPLVLAPNLLLFLGGEVVLDVEGLADLLGGLALDHVRHGHAGEVEQGLDVEVVGSLKEGKEPSQREVLDFSEATKGAVGREEAGMSGSRDAQE